MTPRGLAQCRRVLFTMLTALTFRHPPGREPPVITLRGGRVQRLPGLSDNRHYVA